jgi:serine/threonine protein kinase
VPVSTAITEVPTDPYRLVGRTVAGRYKVESVHRRTRLAVVYQAQHVELRSRVALKVLHMPPWVTDEHRERFLERFEQEARTVAALNHPAMARVLDYGELVLDVGATPWMAIEWLEGRTLEADLAERPGGRRSPREVLGLLGPAFDALACAHETGVAHRDVKPANLLLVRPRHGDVALRVIDFGIAKVMEPDERPDQEHTATRVAITAFSPLYAVTELLTGAAAYRATDERTLLPEALDSERPTPGARGVAVGPWEPVLAKALHVRGAERHPDAGALRAALERSVDAAQAAWEAPLARNALADTQVTVGERPSSPAARPTRRRAWIAAVTGLVVVAAAALIWSSRKPAPPDPPPPMATAVPVTVIPAAPQSVREQPPVPVILPQAPPPQPPRRPPPRASRGAPQRSIIIE